jgi:hypothetical protein
MSVQPENYITSIYNAIDTKLDGYTLYSLLLHPKYKNDAEQLKQLLVHKSSDNGYDFEQFKHHLIYIHMHIHNKERISSYLHSISWNEKANLIQQQTIKHLLKSYSIDNISTDTDAIDASIHNYDNMQDKPCPHCNHIRRDNINATYVICGYYRNGYDWIGCENDWCFKCGKKLCKNWDTDVLYVLSNRTHNNKCCKHQADKNNDPYLQSYCFCYNDHVQRF